MTKIVEYLNQNKVGQFATIKDGLPVMRPFTFIFEKDGKFIFYTDNHKDVYNELKSNSVGGFAVTGEDMNWVRIRGKVGFSDSQELKDEVFKAHPLLEKLYGTSDNPKFEVCCIYDGVASLHNYIGHVLDEIKF